MTFFFVLLGVFADLTSVQGLYLLTPDIPQRTGV